MVLNLNPLSRVDTFPPDQFFSSIKMLTITVTETGVDIHAVDYSGAVDTIHLVEAESVCVVD